MKTLTRKDSWTFLFIAALFTVAKIWRQLKCPLMDKWIKKMLHTHTHTHTQDYYAVIKKNKVLLFETAWMDLK